MPAFAGIFGVKAEFAQFFGGTSLLILVGVVLDTLQQVESHLLTAALRRIVKFPEESRGVLVMLLHIN